jgi:hypothetical protein
VPGVFTNLQSAICHSRSDVPVAGRWNSTTGQNAQTGRSDSAKSVSFRRYRRCFGQLDLLCPISGSPFDHSSRRRAFLLSRS